MKHILKILLILLALTALTVSFVPVSVMASQEYLSIIVSSDIAAQIEPAPIDTSPPSLDIRFEPSGTSVHKGDLKIRLDFYPQPEDKSYESQRVYVVDETSPEFLDGYKGEVDKDGNPIDWDDYQHWLDGLQHIWRVNPCLSHFLTVKPDITLAELDQIVSTMFSGNVTATIDDIMSKTGAHESAHLISPYMKPRTSTTSVKINPEFTNEELLIETVNQRLAGFTIGGEGGGRIEAVEPKSIDVGAGASDRASNFISNQYTSADKNNPSNAAGSLDTYQIYGSAALPASQLVTLATYSASGDVLTCDDSEYVGAITSGLFTATGLTIDVESGEYIGLYNSATTVLAYRYYVDAATSGGAGYWSYYGERKDPGDSATFTLNSNYLISIYATGTEIATYDISNAPSSKAFGAVAAGTTYWSSGSAPDGNLDDAEALFTVTAAGSAAVDIDFHGHNATEGIDCTLTSSAPGSNEYRVKVYKEGDAVPAGGAYLTTSDAEIISNLASSATIDWEISFTIGTPGDGVSKSAIITLTGRAVT